MNSYCCILIIASRIARNWSDSLFNCYIHLATRSIAR